jgi:serine protease
MRVRAMLLGLSAAIALAFGAAPANAPAASAAAVPATLHRIIVKLCDAGGSTLSSAARLQRQSGLAPEAISAPAARNGFSVARTRGVLPGLHVIQIVPQTAGESLETTLVRLRADPAVEYAEPDQRRHALAVPNDPLYHASTGATGQWYLQNPTAAGAPSAVDALDAWTTHDGAGPCQWRNTCNDTVSCG